jgi:hypothetical protein
MRTVLTAVASVAAALILPIGTASAASELVRAQEGVRAVDSVRGVQVWTAAGTGEPSRLYRRIGGKVSRVPKAPQEIGEFDLGLDAKGRVSATVCVHLKGICRSWRQIDVRTGRSTPLRFDLPATCNVPHVAVWRKWVAYSVKCAKADAREGVYLGTNGKSRRIARAVNALTWQGVGDVDLYGENVVAIVDSGKSRTASGPDDRQELWAFKGMRGCSSLVSSQPATNPQNGLASGVQAHLGANGLTWGNVTIGKGPLFVSALTNCVVSGTREIATDETHSSIARDGNAIWFTGGDGGQGVYRMTV